MSRLTGCRFNSVFPYLVSNLRTEQNCRFKVAFSELTQLWYFELYKYKVIHLNLKWSLSVGPQGPARPFNPQILRPMDSRGGRGGVCVVTGGQLSFACQCPGVTCWGQMLRAWTWTLECAVPQFTGCILQRTGRLNWNETFWSTEDSPGCSCPQPCI